MQYNNANFIPIKTVLNLNDQMDDEEVEMIDLEQVKLNIFNHENSPDPDPDIRKGSVYIDEEEEEEE